MRTLIFLVLLPWTAFASLNEQQFYSLVNRFTQEMTPYTMAKVNRPVKIWTYWEREVKPLSQGGAGGASFYSGPLGLGGHIVGGLARSRQITEYSFLFVLCHELGHGLHGGGAEEKADLFAVTVCLPHLLGEDDNLKEKLKVASEEVMEYLFDLFNDFKRGHFDFPMASHRSTEQNPNRMESREMLQCRLDRLLHWSGLAEQGISLQCLGNTSL